MATLQELFDFQNRFGKDTLYQIYNKSPRARYSEAVSIGMSDADWGLWNDWANKIDSVSAWGSATPEQKQLYTEANKLSQTGANPMETSIQTVINNQNLYKIQYLIIGKITHH